jgi:RNA polymerase sigma-70 factor (ECF subfamily)
MASESTPRGPLTEAFIESLPRASALEAAGMARLEERLSALCTEARKAHPDIPLSEVEFLRHVAGHVKDAALGEWLETVRAADLFLACASAKGDPEALRTLERSVLPRALQAVVGTGLGEEALEEVMQTVRHKLVVASEGSAPKIALYSGQGVLRNWVRAMALRMALRARTRQAPQTSLDSELLSMRAPQGADLELGHMKKTYRAEFKRAFEQALNELSPRDRNVLRLYTLDGMNIAQIGDLYTVHRATVARWIAHSREALLKRTRELLSEQLKVGQSELDSLIQMLLSSMEVSIERILVQQAPLEGKPS